MAPVGRRADLFLLVLDVRSQEHGIDEKAGGGVTEAIVPFVRRERGVARSGRSNDRSSCLVPLPFSLLMAHVMHSGKLLAPANHAMNVCAVNECVQAWKPSPTLTLSMGTLQPFFQGKVVTLEDADWEDVQELGHVGGVRRQLEDGCSPE